MDDRLSLRVPPEIKAELDARAEAAGMRPADWHRQAILDALGKPAIDPNPSPDLNSSLHALATWIDRRFEAQDGKRKCDVNAILTFLKVLLEQIMFAEVFARSAATTLPPDNQADAAHIVEVYGRDAATRSEALVQDVNRLVGEARDDGRKRAQAADASLEALAALLEEARS